MTWSEVRGQDSRVDRKMKTKVEVGAIIDRVRTRYFPK